mmetsp:Transcript_5198/g.10995  ORF Transcript_5198/g.10995 Transcript_5198/m.10995 type:complete len:486 (-) Transcript_5198:62-1519(-)
MGKHVTRTICAAGFLLVALGPLTSGVLAFDDVTTLADEDRSEYSSLTMGFDDVLPPDIIDKVFDECRRIHDLGDIYASGDLMHGKKATNWLPLDPKSPTPPRNFVEHAVQKFYELAVPEQFYSDDYNIPHYGEVTRYTKSDIKGGEWWIQARSGKEGIGFHYDKDEAYASIHMRMSFPIISTITYLTDVGAPTLILNQTSLDGSTDFPEVPHEGFLSYPKKNRHVMFRGDLNHGVSKTLSLDENSDSRVTLLINWWVEKPMEPNCMTLSDTLATKIDFNYPEKVAKAVNSAATSAPTEVNSESVPLLNITDPKTKNTKKYSRHMERFPPNDGFHYDMPRLKHLARNTLYAINWSWNHVYASVGMLDLWNRNLMSSVFRIQEPKCFVFVHDDRELEGPFGINWWLQPLAKGYEGEVKFYTATTEKAKNAWGEFGIRESDLPIAVMHDTVSDRKLVMERGVTFGEDKVRDLVEKFFGRNPDKKGGEL